MDTRNRSRWFHRGLLGAAAFGLVVDLLFPESRLGTLSLLLLGIWCVRRILARLDETTTQFERAFRLGQEVEQRRIALDRELAPVRELIRPERLDKSAGTTDDARSAEEAARSEPASVEPIGNAVTLSTARARKRRRHRRRP